MLTADKRDYRRGYKKHYETYKRMRENNSDVNSRRLLLIYSVECGLKWMLLDKWREVDPRKILDGADEIRKDILTSHNLQKLIKELGQQGNFKLPQLITIHKEQVSAEMYHQLYRYCIPTQIKEDHKEDKIEETLESVAEWIEEGM
ncbi:MAG: hypothetical protein LIP12_17625 [Clostridiales bacterium]|nr:hypothetical protein [Clostridiales bacterium]